MRRHLVILSLLFAAGSYPSLGSAQSANDNGAQAAAETEKARSEARKAAAEARKAEIEAEIALEKARFSFLPQSPAEGKVTLGDGAGKAEAAMLTTSAIRQAAVEIADKANPPSADSKARLEGAIKRYEDFYQNWTKPGEAGTVRLAAAIAQAEFLGTDTRVLRVHLDSQGGSLLTRRNLWTALGAKAIAVSGGVVASFTLDNPATGAVEKSGVYICGTTLTDFRRVQKLKSLQAFCEPPEPAESNGGQVAQ